jgi:antitoxin ParD1/3/4
MPKRNGWRQRRLSPPGTIGVPNPQGGLTDGATGCYPTSMTVKPSVSLTDAQYTFALEMVAQGRYASVSAVLQQGLELLRNQAEAEELETAALRALLASRARETVMDAAAFEARIGAMIDERRRAFGPAS